MGPKGGCSLLKATFLFTYKKKKLEEIPSELSFTFCARQREELEVEGAVQGHGEALLHACRLPV